MQGKDKSFEISKRNRRQLQFISKHAARAENIAPAISLETEVK